jgi:hypothetical protein
VTVRSAVVALACLPALACGQSQKNNTYLPAAGATGGGGVTTPSGTVEVSVASPADGAIVSANSVVTVTAMVEIGAGGNDVVDSSSVKASLTAPGGGTAVASSPLIAAGGSTFSGKLSLGALQAGRYTLTVAAASSSGATGQATSSIVIDDGPTITVNSPLPGHAYNGTLDISVAADAGAYPPLVGPTATLAGMPVALSLDAATGAYRATVAFDPAAPPPSDVQVFPALSGTQLLDVTAMNANGVRVESQITFTIDVTGPTIANTAPAVGAVVGGVVQITATVTDPSGVLDSSVIAIVGDQDTPEFSLPLEPQGAGVYGTLFDTNNLTPCKPPPDTGLCLVFPTISFRASDSIGNQTVVTYGISIDNIAPVADLDPPLAREIRLGPAGYECSFAFDPLSVNEDVGDMPNDGCEVPQIFDLRARIEDDGNHGNGLKVAPISTVDPDKTNVFVLSDVATLNQNQPLVVDSDGDGNCDEINPLLVPTTTPLVPGVPRQVLQVRLAGVPAAGVADFRPDPVLPPSAPDSTYPCIQGTDMAPPPLLCTSEQPTAVFSYAGGLPTIWAVEPIDKGFHCVGNQFDTYANNVADGQWICIAVQTTDLAGNRSVSAPMRVYVEYDDAGGFCATPPAAAGPPPTCTGTFDRSANAGAGAAAIGVCRTRQFTDVEYCLDGAC